VSEASEYLTRMGRRLRVQAMFLPDDGVLAWRLTPEDVASLGAALTDAAQVMDMAEDVEAGAADLRRRKEMFGVRTVRVAARRECLLVLIGMAAGSAAVTAGSAIVRLVLG
jgi:hypothetical protein